MSTRATSTLTPTRRSVQAPDATRTFPRGRVDYVRLEDHTLARITLQPGWKWSDDVKPLEGTSLCQTAHLQYVVRGRLVVEMEDKTRLELAPGDFVRIPAGHDAWVEGDEPFEAVDFAGLRDYAAPQEGPLGWRDTGEISGY